MSQWFSCLDTILSWHIIISIKNLNDLNLELSQLIDFCIIFHKKYVILKVKDGITLAIVNSPITNNNLQTHKNLF